MCSKRNDQRLLQGLINCINLQTIMTAAPTPPEIHAQIFRRKHEQRRAIEEAREKRREDEKDIFQG